MNISQLMSISIAKSLMKSIVSLLALLIFSATLHGQKNDYVKGEFIVQLKFEHKVSDLDERITRLKTKIISSRCISEPMNIWLLNFDDEVSDKTILYTLRNDPSVINAQFNHYIHLRDNLTTIPNDPSFANQWYMLNTGQNGGTAGADIKATQAWDITTGGRTTDGDTIVVAVIDGGFEPTHIDLQANHWINWNEIPNNGIDDDRNGYIDDFQGWNTVNNNDVLKGGIHGIEVEGMIGAAGNNGKGIAGVNWNVKIMDVRIDTDRGTEVDVVAGYSYVLSMRRLYQKSNGKKGAYIVATNSSFGANGFAADAPIWCAMYDSLGMSGILNVGATANNNVNVDSVGDLPSTCTSNYLVVVTATDKNDLRSTGAAFGVKSVDVGAPGVAIYTTASNSSYAVLDGTSFATPLVAGIAALSYSVPCSDFINFAKKDPAGATLLLRDWILKSVDVKPDLQGKITTGGRVNAYKTLQQVVNYCSTCQQPSAVNIKTVSDKATITLSVPNVQYKVLARYHKVGDDTWTTITATSSPLSISGLLLCTDYELELKTSCNSDLTSKPSLIIFKTDGCCNAPEFVDISKVGINQFTVNFSKITAANNYTVCIKSIDNNSCIFEKSAADTNYVINNLRICNNYQVSVKSECTNISSTPSVSTTKTLGCGPCFDKTYCKSNGNVSSEWIDSFSVADFKFKSGKNSNYIKFDTVTTTLKSGKKYQMSLTPGFAGTPFFESVRVWIDLNGDGDFDDAGEQIWENPKFNASVQSDSFALPNTLVDGITRMRVSMKYVGIRGTPATPCEIFDGGEVEDYCVKLEKSTAIKPLIPFDDYIIFPNPFSKSFTIRHQDTANRIVRIQLFFPDGRIFYSKDFESNEIEYLVTDLPPLSTNIVFLKIETEKGVLVKKLARF